MGSHLTQVRGLNGSSAPNISLIKQRQPGTLIFRPRQSLSFFRSDPKSSGQKRWIFIGGTVHEEGTIRAEIGRTAKLAVFAYELAGMKDMNNHWAASYVHRLEGMNVAVGYPDGSFRPEQTVTRLEFAKLLTSALGLEAASGNTNFSDNGDIPSWARPHVAAAVEAGLILGL